MCARTWCVGHELVGHVSERQDGDHAVVSIGLNEVVPRDGRWVNVMLSEGADECLYKHQEGRERGREA